MPACSLLLPISEVSLKTRVEFRLLILFNALLIPVAMLISTYDAGLLPPQLQAWLFTRSGSMASAAQSIAGMVSFLAFVAICVGLLGMLAFQRWARWLTLWGTVLIYLPMPLGGATALSGYAYTFDSVAAILWGSLLAAAYWSPVAVEFGERWQWRWRTKRNTTSVRSGAHDD